MSSTTRMPEFFGVDVGNLGQLAGVNVEGHLVQQYVNGVFLLFYFMKQHNLVGNMNAETQQTTAKFAFILSGLKLGGQLLKAMCTRDTLMKTSLQDLLKTDIAFGTFVYHDPAELQPVHRVIIFVLQYCLQRGYRRYHDSLQKEIVVDKVATCNDEIFFVRSREDSRNEPGRVFLASYLSHAFEHVSTLTELVMKIVNKNLHFDLWQDLHGNPNRIGHVVKYLENSHDPELQPLKLQRHVRSFTNGVLFFEETECTFRFVAFDNPVEKIDRRLEACHFFEQNFDHQILNFRHWYNIPTPNFERLLESQRMTPEVRAVVYGLLGRLLFRVGHLDKWQIIPFFKGVAQSGKSTIGNVVRRMFRTTDVGVMSSNIEAKFGLEALVDKLVFICFEVTKNFGLTRSDLQSLVSGESMSIPAKFKTAKTVEWEVPGILFGNELGPWSDSLGSLERRVVIIEFLNRADRVDPHLDEKLNVELPVLIYKFGMAYLEMVKTYKRGFWECCPSYFTQTRAKFAEASNPIKFFLNRCEQLCRHPDAYIPVKDFRNIFRTFTEFQNGKGGKMDEDQLYDVLKQNQLSVRKQTRVWNGAPKFTSFILGITLKSQFELQTKEKPPSEEELSKQEAQEEEDDEQLFHVAPEAPSAFLFEMVLCQTTEDLKENPYVNPATESQFNVETLLNRLHEQVGPKTKRQKSQMYRAS